MNINYRLSLFGLYHALGNIQRKIQKGDAQVGIPFQMKGALVQRFGNVFNIVIIKGNGKFLNKLPFLFA